MSEDRGYVFHATLERSSFVELLAKMFDENAVAIVRRVDGAEFVPFNSRGADAFLSQWTGGQVFTDCQVFNSEAELRWRQAGSIFNVLLLTEKANSPVDFQPLFESPFIVVAPSLKESYGFLLWGTTRDREQWFETRIPRALNYPIKTSVKPKLSYYLYKDSETVCWVRLRNLEEAT